MKKHYLLALLPALILASCGGGAAEETDGGQDASGNTIVKIMFHVDESSDEGKAYKKRIADFNKEYKEKKIKASASYVARTEGTTSYEQVLIAMKTEGTLPSIITFDAPNCASYARSKLIVDISDVFTAEEKNDFLSMNIYQEKVYGVPIQESSAGFYYNKNIFAAAGIDVSSYTVENPWTFDQFKEVCQKLKNYGNGVTPVDMRIDATRDEMATYLLYPIIYAAGGKFVNPSNGKQATGYMNSEASKRGFQFIKDIISSGYTSYSVGSADFFTGKAAMYLSSGWTIPDIVNKYKAVFPDRNSWGILPYPQDAAKASATGSWSYGLTKNSDAAKELLKFLSTAESSDVVTRATGMIPAHKTTTQTFDVGTAEYTLRKQLELYGTPRPETVGYNQFSTSFRNIISNLGNRGVSELVDSVTAQLQSELDKIK